MDKTAIKNFSVWARNALIRSVTDRCGLVGVRADGIQNPLPQSTKDIQFFDAGTGAPSSISGKEIAQRDALVMKIREKERDTDYKTAYNYVIEQVAYTWFNRLIAIRFMEVNDYLPSRIRVLSSEQDGKLEPDIVTNPFDSDFDFSEQERDTIIQLKDRGQMEDMDALFRILFTKQCDALHELLPGLFQKIDDRDYTQLLLNLSFTDREGVVYHLINDIDEADFDINREGQVEIIGWMYQYYNTEPKDETFALLKKNVKITKERIPAATQLFTPDWIVRYMVENSLGRLWVESHPNDDLKENWKYYQEEAEQEASVQTQLDEIRKGYQALQLEKIKLIDPCMGSGHILVYAFDVFMDIYRSQGWIERDAAQSIVQNNLHGLDIDDRAYQLAYFAIMMKARQYDRRFLTRGITPNVYSIQESNHILRGQLKFFGANLSELERNNAQTQLTAVLDSLTDAKEYGTILKMDACDWSLLRRFVDDLGGEEQFSFETAGIDETQTKLLSIISVAEAMEQKYHVVVTNPPYMGASGMSSKLSNYVKAEYPNTKSDLSTVFMERTLQMCCENGYMSMINIPVWMFLTSYEALRKSLIEKNTIVSMLHPGRGIFGSDFGSVTFVIVNRHINKFRGLYRRLFENAGDVESVEQREYQYLSGKGQYIADQEEFRYIPGSPIAYWVSNAFIKSFSHPRLGSLLYPKTGLTTGDNETYLRFWFEVSNAKIGHKWFYMNKGGEFHKWYGNNEYVLNWENNGSDIRNAEGSTIRNPEFYFREGVTWSKITAYKFSGRYSPSTHLFDAVGLTCFVDENVDLMFVLAYFCSCVANHFLSVLNSTVTFTTGSVANLPFSYPEEIVPCVSRLAKTNVEMARLDWDAFETSWDFKEHPLVRCESIASAYSAWEAECYARFWQMKSNEEELNRIFINIYGLQDELTPEVEDKDVTVRRPDLQRDVKSLLSYAVGCMFGRFSLDVEGIAYAGGDWDNSKYSTIIPDADNCIPITDTDYFKDDIVGLFCEWVEKVYGSDTLEENLNFIADALGNKGVTSRDVIRNYFLNDFFKDHCKAYQKRPIYWLYDSGKQNGFKALVYMHRYTEDTTGKIRAEYLFKMQRVYENELKRVQDTIDGSGNAREVAQAEKRKEKLTKQLKETRDYDQKIAHLALARIGIDLDDGVKVNYEKVQTAPDGKKLEILAKI